ncbi:MAG: transposase [Nitrososphaeria archaeon]
MRMSKHSPEEKLQAVMESLDHNSSQAEICRRYGIFPTQLSKWKQQFLEGGKEALSRNRRGDEREEEIESLKKIIGEQSLVIDAFKKRLQGRTR